MPEGLLRYEVHGIPCFKITTLKHWYRQLLNNMGTRGAIILWT